MREVIKGVLETELQGCTYNVRGEKELEKAINPTLLVHILHTIQQQQYRNQLILWMHAMRIRARELRY